MRGKDRGEREKDWEVREVRGRENKGDERSQDKVRGKNERGK